MFDVNEILKATGGNLSGVKSNISVQGISIDSRTIRPQEAFLAIKGNNFDGHNFIAEAIKKGANCIIAMPSKAKQEFKSVPFIEVKDTIKALGDIARYRRKKFNIPVIAITGSNGKTTTKEMAAWILAERFKVLKNEGTKNNQIGLPLTLLNLDSTYGIVVLEIGTNHFGEVAYLSKICQPNIGIITDIGPAHLEYLRNLEGVFKEKRALIENLAKPCLAILNADNVWLKEELAKNYKRPVTFGFAIENQSDLFASSIRSFNGKLAFSVSAGLSTEKRKSKVKQEYKITLKTPGYYNIYNALAAILACRILGIEYRDIISRLNNFDFPPSRLNLIKLN
jgi:UDP-N-acetylmuramoyl-tripeptide--D-alanyl-D-alanine ligase